MLQFCLYSMMNAALQLLLAWGKCPLPLAFALSVKPSRCLNLVLTMHHEWQVKHVCLLYASQHQQSVQSVKSYKCMRDLASFTVAPKQQTHTNVMHECMASSLRIWILTAPHKTVHLGINCRISGLQPSHINQSILAFTVGHQDSKHRI